MTNASCLSELESANLVPLSSQAQKPKPKAVRVRKRKSVAETTSVENGPTTITTVETTETEAISIDPPPKQKRQRKKKEKEPVMPLAPRVSSLLKIGAHVSAAKGVYNSVTNSVHIGGNAFAVFLKNQRKWDSPAFKKEDITQFRELCIREKYSPKTDILPHGSYLVNLANPDGEKRAKAYECFLDELKRCEQLGIQLHNFHPGSAADKQNGIKLIAECINQAHSDTESVKVVLENSAGGTNSIGTTFEDLRGIIDNVSDQSRVGVCIDTCHAFAAGYDLRTKDVYEETWRIFDNIVGFKYLTGLHLNDSRSTLGSQRDLHANLGRGFLGLEPFRLIVNDDRMKSIPMILETPAPEQEIWAEEIKLLYSMVGKEAGDPEILEREKELQELGREDREKQLDALKRKAEKAEKKSKSPRRRKKDADTEESSSESDDSDEEHMH